MFSRISAAIFSNAHILLVLTTLFWAGNIVLGRGVTGHFPPVAMAWFRWTLAFLIILPFTIEQVREDWPVIKKHLPILTFLGILGVGTYNTLAYIGLNHTTAINGLILQSAGPVTIAVMAFFIFRDRITIVQAVGILTSLIGVFAIVSKGDIAILKQLKFAVGDIWLFFAMIVWSVYTIFLRLRPTIHWKSFATITFFIGAIFVTPFYIWEHIKVDQVRFDIPSLLVIAYIGIFPSILAYIFYNRGVELMGPARAGAYLHVIPFFGTILAITLLGEQLRYFHIVGLALILIGVTLASRMRKGSP